MRAHEFILNEKRRKKRKARSVTGPYYGYYYGLGTTTDSGAEGGDGGGMEEGELIPWPKGTVKVDVSDVYDWYKLGQHISNLKGLGKHDFGKGPPQTVMAFGSEPLEHEYIKDLNKIGLKTYDIDEDVTEGKMAELDMDLEDPEITDRQFEKIYGMTRKEARELFSRTNMWDFPQVRDPDRPLHEQGVAESLDSPYSYHWEEGDFGDLNAYAQLSDNTVLDIEFEQINVDKSQWTVGFQRDGQIHKTGKGDEQRVFATVLSAIKEFIENKQPKEVFFSAEKSEVNPESRKRLYDRLVQKYATALGYQASQSETSRETKYKLSRIREQGVAEDADYEREPLYHATLKAFEPSIMKSGLLPGGNLRMFDWSDSKFVYLSNYPDIARDFIDPGVIEPDEEHEEQIFDLMKQGGVILKIDQNKLNRNLLSSDPHFSTDADDGAETYIYSGVIPPSAIIGKEYFSINESKQGVAEENLKEFAPGPDFRDDDDRQDMPLLEFAEIIKLFLGSEYTMIDRKTSEQVSVKFDPKDRTSGHNGAVLYSIIGKKQNEYPTVNFQLIDYEQGPQVGRGRRAGTAILKTRANALKIADIIYNTMGLPKQDRQVEENFADGRNPGRKGLAKRMGVPTKASVSRLRQIAKSSSGEKQRMAHWLANMKAGRKK